MEEYIQNGSLPIRTFSDAQASILDFLFPGFTSMSTAVQRYLTIDLNVYIPLLCFFGLVAFACGRTCKYCLELLNKYFTSSVHLRFRDEAYDMVMMWISSQSFTKNARSLLATTELASSNRLRNHPSNCRNAKQKTLHYTPWNGRFFMWYKGHLLVFRREYLTGEISEREEVSISCFGRSPQILKELVSECNTEYAKSVRNKTCLYRHQDYAWVGSKVSGIRRTSTVILDESRKLELLEDIEKFLNPISQRWYSSRGIPYRKGYLLYGPPGTGKSSLSLSIAGHFGLDIYILNLSSINESTLESLFSKLPSRCIILLEDIDAVSSKRSGDAETKDSLQVTARSVPLPSKSGNVSLSALLNVIDGVGSQEGRILIMTTNYITRLDKALIRPGRVDKKVELGLANKKMAADIFRLIFKPVEGDVDLSEFPKSDGLIEDGKVPEIAWSEHEEAEVERLAEQFAAKVPELEFSPAEIQLFLLENRQSPVIAVANVAQWIAETMKERRKAKNELQVTSQSPESESTQPSALGDGLTETARVSTPPSYCSSWQNLPGNPPPSRATPYLSSLCLTPGTNQSRSPVDSAQFGQQVFHILMSLSNKQDPSPPPAADEIKSEELPTRASKRESKTADDSTTVFPVVPSSDAQELFTAVVDMHIPSGHPPKFTCSYTPSANSSEATSTGPCSSPTPYHTSPVLTTEHVQQFFDFLQSLKQGSPPPPTATEVDSSEDAKPKEVLARASLLDFKEVTEMWDDKAYKYTVVESPKSSEIDNLDEYVFVVRGRIDKKTKETTYYVDVKSSTLRDTLRKVLQNVPGISIMEEQLSIERNTLYHFLPETESFRNGNAGLHKQTSNDHVGLLVDHIKSSYTNTTERLEALLKGKEITYDLLWALFKPNALAYTTCQGTKKPRCIRYESGEEKTTETGVEFFHIKGSYLDFDGKILGKVSIETAILKFPGSSPINSLEVFPLCYHEEKEAVINKLVECGRKFCSLAGVHHRQYKGRAFQMKKGKPVEVTINSRIMVDAAMFQDVNPNYARPSMFKKSGDSDLWDFPNSSSNQLDESAVKKGMDVDKMSEEDFQLCSPTVLGFSLEDKLWLEFAVADITEICWDESIFDRLEIPRELKTLIRALTAQLSSPEKARFFDDFVKGKGRGLSILLYGPPGVGKTMTAEALSELLHKPLFTVSAANFSNDPAALDKQLSGIFEVANHWDTLLLLDEADSSLRKRSTDSHHNSLVSVFLRKIEYFQGIMILTTNRVTEFDDAVQSRIHVGIPYGRLGPDTRRRLWESFLKKPDTEGKATSLSTEDLKGLAEHELNGRQIKNAVRAGHALANFDRSNLSIAHLQTVLNVGKVFEADFHGTGNLDNMNGYR